MDRQDQKAEHEKSRKPHEVFPCDELLLVVVQAIPSFVGHRIPTGSIYVKIISHKAGISLIHGYPSMVNEKLTHGEVLVMNEGT
jgi:hypothetical protein